MDKNPTTEKKVNIFISYSRKDKEFVQKLHNKLEAAGLETWVDWEGIPLTADWWQEIKQGIENADAFAFVVSPDSLKSKVCGDEIQTAVDNNKRLIPILHRDPEKGDPIHPKVSAHNWIYMRDDAQLEAHMPDMVQVIHTDLDWVKAHTRLLRRAVEWETGSRNNSLLLRGEDLKQAENWLGRSGGKEPAPTELQTRYIQESRSDTKRRTRLLAVGVTVSLIIAFLAIFSYLQSVEANYQRGLAEDARATAVIDEQQAVLQKEIAVFAQATAEFAEATAVAAYQVADEQRVIAVTAEAEAENQKIIAEQQRDIAVTAEAETATQRDIATDLKEEALALKTAITGELLAQQDKFVLSTLVALQSYQQRPTIEGEQLLRSLLARLPAAKYELNHDDWVNDVAFSPDGSRLLTASDDGTAVVWDMATGRPLFSLPHDGIVLTAAFSPNGSIIATGDGQNLEDDSYAGVVTLWDAATGAMIRQFPHKEWINDVEFSPNGRSLAYGVYDGTMRMVNVANGIIQLAGNQPGSVWDVTFSPDGDILITSDEDGRAWVWDVPNGSVLKTLLHDGPIYGASFSPDGERLVTYSADGSARVWNRFNWLRVSTLYHEDEVWDAAFSPNSQILATASKDGTARLWEPDRGKGLFEFTHEGPVNDLAFSPDGKMVVTNSNDNTSIMWDVTTGQKVANMIHEAPVYTSAFSPDGTLLATADMIGVVNVWDVTKDTAELSRATHPTLVTDLALTADGTRLVTTSHDGLRVWDVAALEANDLTAAQALKFVPFEQGLKTVSISPDNHTVAAAGPGGILFWDMVTGVSGLTLADSELVDISQIAFSPDGTRLVTVNGGVSNNSEIEIKVWDSATGDPISDPIGSSTYISDIAFTPDGEQIVIAGDNGRVQFYDVATGEEGLQLEHNEAAYTLAFSPDGRSLATGSADNTARIWNAHSGELEATLFHNNPVTSLAYTPDGRFLLTGSQDGNLRYWELATMSELGRIHQGDAISAMDITPDGRLIVTSNNILAALWEYDAVRLWRPSALEEVACSRLTRNLTRSEWDQYISNDAEEQPFRLICPDLVLEE